MKSIYFNVILILIFCCNAMIIYANNGGKPNRKITRDSFSGKVFLLGIGINNYKEGTGYHNLISAESDVINFKSRLRKETKIKEICEYIYLSNSTKDDIIKGIKEIERTCRPNDILIFFGATYGNSEGDMILSDGTTISSTEFYINTRNILCLNQLFFLDIMNGDKYISNLTQHLSNTPYESKITNSNVVIFSVDGLALETSEGGYFTLSYTKNDSINIFDLFSNSDRVLTDFKKKFYSYSDKLNVGLNFEIAYFSERLETEKLFSNKLKDSILVRKSDPINKNTKPNTEFSIKQGETLALIFGCKDFNQLKELKNSLNDARSIKNILELKYNSKVIYLENPDQNEFYKELAKIQKDYNFEPGSQFLFFAATHGTKNNVNEGYIALKDTYEEYGIVQKGISLTTLIKVIAQLKCSKSLAIIDACYSIFAFDKECTAPNPLPIPENSKIYNSMEILGKNYLTERTNLFFGSSHNQEAADGSTSNSPFTSSIINFLENNQNKVSDSYYLEKYIKENVMREGAISLPLFCTYACRSDGRFFFFKK